MGIRTVLRTLGLTDGESRVYLALLQLGRSSVGPITKESGVSSSKIYNVLNRLVEKSIVSYIVEGRTRYYSVLNPKYLQQFIEQERAKTNKQLDMQQTTLKNSLPSLEALYLSKEDDVYANVYEGIEGIKAVFDMCLDECSKGDEPKTLGYPRIASKLLNAYFKEYNRRLSKNGVKAKVIFTHNAWFGKKREKRKHAKYRYLPKGVHTPAFLLIYHDKVCTMVLTKKKQLCFVIKNEETAKSYKTYFDFVWKSAKKVR
ncbi:MAG: hypothetical protein OXR66_03510 [Candidatus Woesearchaeota archaeon]|nr:hypothetical protein [Candidatus Woesearchaeota archaeon]